MAAARAEFDEVELQRRREQRDRQQEVREHEEERQRIEARDLIRLVENSRAWLEARRLRRFIHACEAAMVKIDTGRGDSGAWRQNWLAWATKHADRLDPMTSGCMETEYQGLRKPEQDLADKSS